MGHMSKYCLAAGVVSLALAGCSRPAGNAVAPTNAAPAPANAAAAAPASASTDAADAKAFLDGLYAHYKTADSTFDMFGANEAEVFDADTIKLLKDDEKALKGELGTVDGDWLCACQDRVSLRTTVTILSATPTTAKATADFTDTGMPGQEIRHNDFDLVKVNGVWRIHDVTNRGDPSLRTQLTEEIRTLNAPHHGKPNPDEAP